MQFAFRTKCLYSLPKKAKLFISYSTCKNIHVKFEWQALQLTINTCNIALCNFLYFQYKSLNSLTNLKEK